MYYEKLKKTREFSYIYKNGENRVGNYIILIFLKNQLPYSRIGIVVSKKVGCAVVRNKIKRRIREIVRLNAESIPQGFDIVIISKSKAKNANFQMLREDILKSFLRLRGL